MDKLMEGYLSTEKEELFHDCKYRAKYETWLNRAYAMMLEEQGFLSHEEYREIDKGLVAALRIGVPAALYLVMCRNWDAMQDRMSENKAFLHCNAGRVP